MNKAELKKIIREVILEAASEPKVISTMRKILKNNQGQKVKDPVSGKQVLVPTYMGADIIVMTYDGLSGKNKEKFVNMSISGMHNIASKIYKKLQKQK